MPFDADQKPNPSQMSPLALAFLGDAVFTLLVKAQLLRKTDAPVGRLHEQSAKRVNAAAQAAAFRVLEPQLSTDELAVFPYEGIGTAGCDRLAELAAPLSAAVMAADLGFPAALATR